MKRALLIGAGILVGAGVVGALAVWASVIIDAAHPNDFDRDPDRKQYEPRVPRSMLPHRDWSGD